MHLLIYFFKKNLSFFFPTLPGLHQRMSMQNNKKLIGKREEKTDVYANPDESFPIVITSLSFMVPGSLCFHLNMRKQGMMVCANSIISTLFWMNAKEDSWRRQLDLAFAKLSMILFMHTQYMHFTNLNQAGFATVFNLLTYHCYLLSKYYHERGYKCWKKFHVGFHMCVLGNISYFIHQMLQEGVVTKTHELEFLWRD